MKLLRVFTFLSFLFFSLVILIHTNTSFDQDLGRHIKLGEIIVKTASIPDTNLFSYTHTDFPFLNHHWLSEVIFYLLFALLGGAITITFFKIIILFITILLIFKTAIKRTSLETGFLSLLIFLPLFIYRTDERPEIFGFLFFAIYFFIYQQERVKDKPGRWIWIIPVIQMIWVNIHITFVYGLILLIFFAIDEYVRHKKLSMAKILGLSLVLSLVNPYGLSGLIYPLSVFKNYGYSIQENQNLFFLSSVTSNIFINLFWIQFWLLTIFGAVGGYFAVKKGLARQSILYFTLAGLFAALGVMMIRNFPFFALTSIICFSHFLHLIGIEKFINAPQRKILFYGGVGMAFIFCAMLVASNWFYETFDINKKFELHAKEQYKGAAQFVNKERLKGPIFNNFDIGGYLDFSLYPKYKVFVDNRPEAYPTEFFEEYKNSQTDLKETEKLFKKYYINTVVFAHTDGTPWGSSFIKNIPKLIHFEVVFLDKSVVILKKGEGAKNTEFLNARIEKLIEDTNDYIDLLILSRFASLVGNNDAAREALGKAYIINTRSCTLRLHVGISYVNSESQGLKLRGREILESTSICPYTKSIKEELKFL